MAVISTSSRADAQPILQAEPTRPIALRVRKLCVRYNGEPALEDITFDVREGERIAIIGPNGAGKSTLIKAIMGLLQPASGSIEITEAAHGIGYVPQHENVDWSFPVTVRDVVMMGAVRRMGWLRWPGRADWARVDAALERVDMLALGHRQIGELSGGQRRRAFIARALVQDAHTLILDEPFSGVDASAQTDLMAMLDRLNADGLTILLSTHDLDLAFHRFDRVLALRKRVIAYGAPETVYRTETLSQLYGQQIIAWHEGQPVSVFVDEHGCGNC